MEELINPFNGGFILLDEEKVLASLLADSDMSERYLRSIMNRIARDMLTSGIGEDGLETRIKNNVKFKFYNSLLNHIGDIRKKGLKSSQ